MNINLFDRLPTTRYDNPIAKALFVFSLICIVAFSIFLFGHFTGFYKNLDNTTKNSTNMNAEYMDSYLPSTPEENTLN